MPTTEGRQTDSAPHWAPPPCDPKRVMEAIRAEDIGACEGRLLADGRINDSNVVERMAIAFGILRKQQATQRSRLPASTAMWECLEAIGTAVSPEFAEQGSDALTVLQLAEAYLEGRKVDVFAETRAFRALGRLWTAAFAGPSGMDLWIGNSAQLISNPRFRFFLRSPESLPEKEALGQYLATHVDLLQAAIATNGLIERVVDWPMTSGQWSAKVGKISVEEISGTFTFEVHRKAGTIGANGDQLLLKLIDAKTGELACIARFSRMTSTNGMYDEFTEMVGELGGVAEYCIDACFHSDDLVGLWPRVRRALDEAENYISQIGIFDMIYVQPRWRAHDIASACVRQMLVDYPDLDLLMGVPRPMELAKPEDPNLYDEAMYCAGSLRIARAFKTLGAKYLVNGVMGLQRRQLFQLSRQGAAERF